MARTNLLRYLSLGRLVGPVFGKELRVASRRRRSYVLRFVYVSLLTIFVVGVWLSFVGSGSPGSVAYQSSRLGAAGRYLAVAIVWFQFVAAQVAAPVLLGDAIRSEVRKRTLHVLAVTPLSGMQIVGGKLAGGLLPIVMLLATSLPLLAVVRVLGGIAWSYVIVSLCVTAATVIFVGSVSLFFSALCRRAYIGVAWSVWSLAFVFAVVPTLVDPHLWTSRSNLAPLAALNPYVLLKCCPNLPAPGAVVAGTRTAVTCCLLLLLAARSVLAFSERLVLRVALCRAMGEPVLLDRLRRGRFRDPAMDPKLQWRPRNVRRVVGPPMIWKELTCTLSSREKFVSHTILGVEIVLILIAYMFPIMMSVAPYEFLHLAYFYCNRFILNRWDEAVAETDLCGRASGKFSLVRCGPARC